MKLSAKNTEILTFDEVLERRLSAGRYQWLAMLFLCFVDLNDGVELLAMSLILPIVKREWQLSSFEVELLSSIFYLGGMLGSQIAGSLADRYGRRKTIIYASMVQFVVAFSFYWANGVGFMLILRFVYGFVFGFSLPLSISMVSEIFPLKYRGKCIICTNFSTSIGRLYAILLAYVIFTDYHTGNWRLLMVLCSFSSLIVVVGAYFFLKESPRFLISAGKFAEGFRIIDEIGKINKGDDYEPLTERERVGLKNFQEATYKSEELASFKMLFSKKCLPVTIRLWVLWFAFIFFAFGSLVVLPFIFANQKKGFEAILITIAGEIPAVFIALLIIDLKNFGRKNSLTLCYIVMAVLNVLCYVASTSGVFELLLSVQRFVFKISSSMLVPLTSELYPTNYRTVGYGWATSIGRFAGTICPYVLLPLYTWDVYSSFLAFAVLFVVSIFTCHSLKYDTADKYLDSFLEEEEVTIQSPELKI